MCVIRRGNNLYSVVKPGDKWCLCQDRYYEAFLNNKAPSIIKNATNKKSDGLLKDKSFLVTGKLNGISRAEIKTLIEENSGTTVSSISKKLNYLIVGEKPTKRKIETAKELKIKTLDQKEFLKMLNKTS